MEHSNHAKEYREEIISEIGFAQGKSDDSLLSLGGLESGEGLDLEKLNGGVELLLGILILVLGSGNSDTHKTWDVPDTARPEESVELGVHSDIRSVHLLLGESLAFSDSSGGSLLEGNTLESLVHVQSVVSGDGLHLGGSFLDHS